jgi:cytochrome oxidase Cu insertion factor (SCO1/SenC/PrrC family)
MNTVDPKALRRSRMFLILIGLVFAAPMIVAGLLTWSGWQPGAKGNGQPIVPQRNFVDGKVQVTLANGQPYAWRDSKPRMTLIALPGPDCAQACVDTLTRMAAARITLNRNQSRLRLLYLGTQPPKGERDGMDNYWQIGRDVDGKLAGYRPTTPDSVSALLVESNGTALSLYPAGFNPTGLRKDLQKVIK